MSRLDFAPPVSEMKVDVQEGTLEFTARAGTHIDQDALKKAVEEAGYKVEDITVTATGNKKGRQ